MKNDGILLNFLFRHEDSFLKIINIVIAAVLVIDITFEFLSFIVKLTPTIAYEIVFVILVSVLIVGQLLIVGLINHRNKEIIVKAPYLKALSGIVRISQYVLSAIIVLISLQIALFSSYQTSILTMGSTGSYAIAVLTMGVLSLLFFKWYLRNKTFAVFMYGSAFISVALAFLLIAILTGYVLPGMPAERNPDSQANLFVFESNPTAGGIQYIAATYSAVSFLLFWVSTIVLLSHYAKRIGNIRFWSIMSIPIISFVIQFAVVVPIMASLAGNTNMDVVYVTIFGNVLPAVSGGLLYGVPFWIVSRVIKNASAMMRRYLVIAAWGAVFLQLASSGSAYTAPYPPFGFVALVFTPVACYLVLFGIYSSAISMSQESKLRQSIRKYAIEESAILRDIGSANIEETIEKKVSEIVKKTADSLTEESGVHPSLTNEEAKDYLKTLLTEINRMNLEKREQNISQDSSQQNKEKQLKEN